MKIIVSFPFGIIWTIRFIGKSLKSKNSNSSPNGANLIVTLTTTIQGYTVGSFIHEAAFPVFSYKYFLQTSQYYIFPIHRSIHDKERSIILYQRTEFPDPVRDMYRTT